ncbi:MAG: sugar transferase [Candidatus Atribacteria bacterium]|nr:MAG: sugar transferase [Candidatus Atribacteria bacterium]
MKHALKRAIDLIASLILLLAVLPVLAIASIAILLSDGRPISFRQERIGQGGRSLTVWKLRTMVVGASNKGLGHTVSHDDARITRVGRFLRASGIDELPQLFNVLAGDMSLVGPRPTLAYQVAQYDAFQRRRLEMKPGITSLAVVSGRNALLWEERIKLDVWYIDHWSLRLDLSILFRTLWKVLITREGLYGPDGVNDMFVAAPKQDEVERDAR